MKNKNIKLWIAALACLAGWNSCTHEEYVDVDYPEQQIYMPAANVSADGIYLIDDVPTASLSEEVQGNPYRFKVDMKTYDFIVPLAVYRSGIEDGGELNIDLRVNNDTIQKLINAGKLEADILPADRYRLEKSAKLEDGSTYAPFDLIVDLKYLDDNYIETGKKFAVAIEAQCNERQLNHNVVIVVIDTKIMRPTVDFTFSVDQNNWKRILFKSAAKYAYSSTWTFGEGDATSSLANPSYTYTDRGSYQVTYKAVGVTGEEVSLTKTVPVLNIGKLSNVGWSILDCSSEEPEEGGTESPLGYATAMIDGDLTTFWHSRWKDPVPGYPHWVAVDMGAEYIISSFVCYRRPGDNRGQTKNRFWTSLDGVNWDDQGEFPFDPETDAGQTFAMNNYPTARYFKYEATEGPNAWAFLAEIEAYGEVE